MLLEINKKHVIALAILIFCLVATIWEFVAIQAFTIVTVAEWSLFIFALIGIITGIVFVVIDMRKK